MVFLPQIYSFCVCFEDDVLLLASKVNDHTHAISMYSTFSPQQILQAQLPPFSVPTWSFMCKMRMERFPDLSDLTLRAQQIKTLLMSHWDNPDTEHLFTLGVST